MAEKESPTFSLPPQRRSLFRVVKMVPSVTFEEEGVLVEKEFTREEDVFVAVVGLSGSSEEQLAAAESEVEVMA